MNTWTEEYGTDADGNRGITQTYAELDVTDENDVELVKQALLQNIEENDIIDVGDLEPILHIEVDGEEGNFEFKENITDWFTEEELNIIVNNYNNPN